MSKRRDLFTLPEPPPGAIGWNVYSGGGTFVAFVPRRADRSEYHRRQRARTRRRR